MPQKEKELYTGIEIGTSSIKIAICSVAEDYSIELLGWGEAPSGKVIKGDVKDSTFVSDQIDRAIKKATQQAGVPIDKTFTTLAFGGKLATVVPTSGRVDFDGMSIPITEDHIVAAIREANKYRPKDTTLKIHRNYTRYYTIKDDKALLNPIGKVSTFIEAHNHAVLFRPRLLEAYAMNVTNVTNCSINTVAYTPMALACGIFCQLKDTPSKNNPPKIEPPSNGYLLIDIGAGVTSYALYTGKDFFNAGQITVGCDHAANDLAIAFSLSIDSTRKILRDFANLQCSVIPVGDGRTRLIAVDQGQKTPKNIPASAVEQIVQVRFQELFNIIDKQMDDDDAWQWATGGVMISGGGAMIPKIADLASNVFRKPVTIAHAAKVSGDEAIVNSPANLLPFGLVRFGKQDNDIERLNNPQNTTGRLKEIFSALINW